MTFTLKIIQGRKVTGLEKKTQKVTGSKPVVTGSKPVVMGSKRVLEWMKNCRKVELLFLKVFVVQLVLLKSAKWRLVKKT